jgi:hypothetical protein
MRIDPFADETLAATEGVIPSLAKKGGTRPCESVGTELVVSVDRGRAMVGRVGGRFRPDTCRSFRPTDGLRLLD